MQEFFGLESIAPNWQSATLCIGTFDGVHLGHQAVIRAAIADSSVRDQPCIVITFDRHPLATLAPEKCPPSIGTLQQNLENIKRLGVSLTVVLAFDRRLADMSHEEFFDRILIEKLHANHIVIGHDFAFGKNRLGTSDWLGSRISTRVVSALEVDGVRVSSRNIRRLIVSGKIEEANRLLSHRFALDGIVVEGAQIGRTLGFPTANLVPSSNQAIPSDGVYAGAALLHGCIFMAAIGIGKRPTVMGTHRTVEAYLLDFDGAEFYGADLRLSFHSRLRDEIAFESLESLKRQMAIDVEQVRSIGVS